MTHVQGVFFITFPMDSLYYFDIETRRGNPNEERTKTMTKLLVSDDNPNGAKMEDILRILRNDIIARCNVSVATHERETEKVVANNMRILNLLTECIDLAEASTDILVQAYGVEQAAKGIARRPDAAQENAA
jgi:UDP-N-acetylmuramyl tripeptide synthase